MIVLMEYIIVAGLAVIGLILGSFAAATVWRLRARQLVEDKKAGEKVDAKEYKRLVPLTRETRRSDRSRCLHCGHMLAWNDLLPLVSWLSLRGRCRYCKERIGSFEPLMELGMAALFVGSYLLWPLSLAMPLGVAQFALWLIAVVMLVILLAYDAKWFLLPDRVMWPLIVVGAVFAVLTVAGSPQIGPALATLAVAIVVLSGLYLLLWIVSKGQWIGFGDVKLGLALALLLGQWQLAFLALFAANLIGCLLVIPGMMAGKISRTTRVPFGPLLIVGMLVAFFFGGLIIDWYMGLIVL